MSTVVTDPIIAYEHIEAIPYIKNRVDQKVRSLLSALPRGARIRVFLSRDAHQGFRALLRVSLRHGEVVCSRTAVSLNAALTAACNVLRHQVSKQKEKRTHQRRKGDHHDRFELPLEHDRQDRAAG